jgi:hypothetical protein
VRLSEADRELLFEQLARHAAEGRLEVDELELRVGMVARATTREQAAAALSDLPPLADTTSGRRPRRSRGHGQADRPAPDWHPTEERFRDPRTRTVMRVWVDSLGGRHYVPEQ